EPLGQRVIERPQIGRQLLFKRAGQEAKALAGLDRRPGQHDATRAPGFERFDRLGDGEIGLAGARWSERHDDGTLVDGVHQTLLRRAHRPDVLHIFSVARILVVIVRAPAAVAWEERMDGRRLVILQLAGFLPRGTLCHGYSLVTVRHAWKMCG